MQGNILAGEDVVDRDGEGVSRKQGQALAERLYAALVAGDAKGGDSRGRQSAVAARRARQGRFRRVHRSAVDVRVDDHADPIVEMGRIMNLALVNDDWNRAWTAFTEKRYKEALPWQERAAATAEKQPSMLPEVLYDLACIRLALGDRDGARKALDRALCAQSQAQAAGGNRPRSRGIALAQFN